MGLWLGGVRWLWGLLRVQDSGFEVRGSFKSQDALVLVSRQKLDAHPFERHRVMGDQGAMLRFFLFVDSAHLQDQLHIVFGFISEALFELFAQGQLFELFAWGRGLLRRCWACALEAMLREHSS